jgi:DNA-binding phage protein
VAVEGRETMTALRDVIKALNADGVNISAVAAESDVSRAQVIRIKNGYSDPGLETTEKILSVLGYEVIIQKKKEPVQ